MASFLATCLYSPTNDLKLNFEISIFVTENIQYPISNFHQKYLNPQKSQIHCLYLYIVQLLKRKNQTEIIFKWPKYISSLVPLSMDRLQLSNLSLSSIEFSYQKKCLAQRFSDDLRNLCASWHGKLYF